MSKLEIGNVVRIKMHYTKAWQHDQVGVITDIESDPLTYPYRVIMSDGEDYNFKEHELILIQSKND